MRSGFCLLWRLPGRNRRTVVSSDAHYLWDIAEAEHPFEPGDDSLSRLVLASLGKQPL